jgi:nitrate reductase gamma subunit
MRDLILFGLSPYAVTLLLIVVPAWRSLSSAARRERFPELCRESARLYYGSAAWRWGLGLLLLGHGLAFAAPGLVASWDRSPVRLLLLEGAGVAAGAAALIGLDRLSRRRRDAGGLPGWQFAEILLLTLTALAMVSGLAAAALYRWGSQWYSLSLEPWVRSLAALHPDVSLVTPLPPLVKLHVLAGLGAAAALPFTRALFALAWPWVWLHARLERLRQARLVRGAATAAEAVLALSFCLLLTSGLQRVGVSQGYAPVQPIAFSHKVHAGDNHIPCLYCHFAAETSRHAGIPPTGVCMGCHGRLRFASAEVQKVKEAFAQRRPLRWVKVHGLPDFVFFSHGQHVRAGGLACQGCHGAVETMERVRQVSPLTMGWCLDCHRREQVVPAVQRRGGSSAHPVAHQATGGLDCGKCHY